MDFKQLEAFVYVVKLKSFSKAAQRIYLTQPTISAHINSLEKELDTKLIERGTKYVYPTKPGSILYQYAVKMLNLRDDACCSVKNYNKELKGTLSICASTVPSQYILPKVVSAFREEYPHVTFNIQRQDSELVVENIAKGMADIGFCGTDTHNPDCVFESFIKDHLVIITPNTERYIPFDYSTFFSSPVQIHVGATNLLTGRCDFFGKDQMDKKLFPARASAALPLFSYIFYLNGVPYLDGGIACPIPIARSVRDGNKKHVIILTRNASFVRKPTSHMHLIRQVYRQYPNFIATEEKRHLIDRRQRSSCALLSKTGQAFVLQPKQPLTISAMRADEQSLRELYIQGYEEAKEAFPQLMEFLSSPAQ